MFHRDSLQTHWGVKTWLCMHQGKSSKSIRIWSSYVSWFMLFLGSWNVLDTPVTISSAHRMGNWFVSWGCQVVASKKAGWKKRNWLTETLVDRLLCLSASFLQKASFCWLCFLLDGMAAWICPCLPSQCLRSWPTHFERASQHVYGEMQANVDSRSMAGVPAVLLTYTCHAQLVSLFASFRDKMVVSWNFSTSTPLKCIGRKLLFEKKLFLKSCVSMKLCYTTSFLNVVLLGPGAMNLRLKFKDLLVETVGRYQFQWLTWAFLVKQFGLENLLKVVCCWLRIGAKLVTSSLEPWDVWCIVDNMF